MQKRSSWQIQKAVFLALFARELKTRFGGYKLGYFWALIEPLSHILVLSFLFSFMRGGGYYDIPFPVFFATGILTFFVFQKIVLTSQSSITANRGLFVYRQVKPFDSIVLRASIEVAILIAVLFFLMWLGAWVFGFQTMPHNPLAALAVLIILFLFALGLGFITAIVGAMYVEWAKFIPLLMRPLYFISGIIFPLDAIPARFHSLLLWNPVLHAVEQFRAFFIEGYPASSTSIFYVLAWALPSLLVGLAFYRMNRTRVLMT